VSQEYCPAAPCQGSLTTLGQVKCCPGQEAEPRAHGRLEGVEPVCQDSATKGYVQGRLAQGKTIRDIKRCLKRYIARQLLRGRDSILGEIPSMTDRGRPSGRKGYCPAIQRGDGIGILVLSDHAEVELDGAFHVLRRFSAGGGCRAESFGSTASVLCARHFWPALG
jgi:hypothetical protein